MKEINYGVVAKFDNGTELWLEAITDELGMSKQEVYRFIKATTSVKHIKDAV